MNRQGPFSWREISIHGINTLGICVFVGFMLNWPRFYDSGPPIDWVGLSNSVALNTVWLYLPVFFIDLLPGIVFSREGAAATDCFRQPLSSAILFGMAAVILLYAAALRAFPDEYFLVFTVQNAQQAAFLFLLHFIPIFAFEVIVRSLWLMMARTSQ